MGGQVPESFYLCNKKSEASDDIENNKTCITLASGEKKQIEFQVDSTANSMVLR